MRKGYPENSSASVMALKHAVNNILLLLILSVFTGAAWGQSITKTTPGTATQVAIGGGSPIAWSTSGTLLSAINANDNVVATVTTKNKSSQHIRATNWGFTSGGTGGFPANTSISGIKVEIKRNAVGEVVDASGLQLLINGLPVGTSRHRTRPAWPTQSTYASYGSSSDKWGLTSINVSDIIASGFGVQFAADAKSQGNSNSTANIDHVRITVYFGLSIYYSKATGSLSTLATWGTNTDGTGTVPTNFSADNQIFILTNRASGVLDAPLTISGANSKLIVGDPNNALAKTTFTIPAAFAYTGIVDATSKDGTTANSSDIVITNTSIPTIGSLAAGTTVTYNAAGDQPVAKAAYENLTITGTGIKSIQTTSGSISTNGVLTINPGANLNLNGQTLTNNADLLLATTVSTLVNNGTISGTGKLALAGPGEGLTNISGTGTISNLEITNTNGATIITGASQTITSSLTLTAGTFNNSGTFSMATGSTIYRGRGVFGAASPGTNVYDVVYTAGVLSDGITANNTGNELAGAALRNVTVSLPSGQSVTLAASRTMTGNLLISTGTLNGGSATLTIGGNFTNNSTFTPSTSTIAFNSTSATTQTISGSGTIGFAGLTINNTGTGGVTIAKDVSASTLTLTNGKLFTGTNVMIVNPGGTTSRTNGWVVGNLRKTTGSGNGVNTLFEVGTTNYTPITVNFANGVTAGTLQATAVAGDNPVIGSSDIDASKSVNTYWQLSTPAGSTLAYSSYGLTFGYTTADNDNVANATSYKLGKYLTGWIYVATPSTRTSTSLIVPNNSYTSAQGFGQYQIGVQGTQPVIGTQPVAANTCGGASTSFTATATAASFTISSVVWQISNDGVNYSNLTIAAPYSVNTTGLSTLNASTTLSISNTTGLSGNYYRAQFTNSGGSASSSGALLTASANPSISTSPSSVAICPGGSNDFSVVATGGNLTYQWRKGGVNISGATSSTYSLNNISSGDAGNYDVIVTNNCSSITSSAAALTVNALPSITSQPSNLTICSGTLATLSVAATGTGLTYQWTKDNIDLVNGMNGVSGATSATLQISNTPLSASGTYNVVINGTCASGITSNDVILTVDENATITSQPVGQDVCSGANVQFNVVASGTSLSYQWRRNGVNLSNGAGISGVTTATLNLTSVAAANAGDYTVVIQGSNCPSGITSDVATLNVTTNVSPSVSIAITSGSNPTCSGTPVTFTATPVNGGTPSYQWKKDGLDVGTNSATYTDAGTTAGSITVVMTSSLACVTSSTATSNAIALAISSPVTPSVSIAITSGTNPTCTGVAVTFTATPVNGGTPSYQWKKDGNNVGTNSATYTDAGATSGNISVVMTSSLGCVTSSTANSNTIALSVQSQVTPSVSIAITSGSNPTCQGNAVTFTATPTNGGTPSYQWKKDGNNVGTNSSTYTDAGTTAGSITVVMTSSIPCVSTATATSNAIALNITTLVTPAVSIAITAGSNPTCSGTAVTFTATPTNGGTPSYQWKKDGNNVGTNSATYTDAGTTAGSITVVMTSSITCVTSATATSNAIALSITPQVTPSVSIAITSGSNPTCAGTPVTFTATPTNGGTPSYQWKKDGSNVGSNSATYTDAGTTAGSITVVMTSSITCVSSTTATSNAIALSVTPLVTPSVSIAITTGSNPTCSGTQVTFTATPTNGGTPSYQWKKDGVNVGSNNATYTDAGTTPGSITVVMTSSLPCVTSSTATSNAIALAVDAIQITSQPEDQSVCNSTTVQFSVTATGSGLIYQWKKDGTNLTNGGKISGATTATLTVTNVNPSNAGVYTVLVTTAVCTTGILSDPATLSISANPTPTVSIAIQSGTNPTCSGSPVSFVATPTFGGTPSYQWTKNGVNVGTNSDVYTDAGTAAGNISVTMTSSLACASPTTATSNVIALSITPQAPTSVSIAITSGSNPTCSGSAVTFTATPTNGGTPSYQWKKDGNNVGTNSATYTDAGSVAGSITVEMTSSLACVTSATATSNAIALGITAPVTPSVSIAITAGSNPTCSGSPVTFTATPTNGGTPSYQWKKDGINVGTNSASYTDPGTTAGSVTVDMTSSLSCVTTSMASSNAIALTTITNTWLAGTDGDWNKASNWCSNLVPTLTSDAIIPSANTPYPVLSANGAVRSLDLQGSATVSIAANTLSINGAITGTGALSGTANSNLVLSGVNNQDIRFTNGGASIKDLQLSHSGASTVLLGSSLDVYGSVSFAGGNDILDFAGNLVTIKSTMNGTGSIGTIPAPANTHLLNASNVTVERYIPGDRSWRMLTLPVQGTKTIRDAWANSRPPSSGADNAEPGKGTLITGQGYTSFAAAAADPGRYDYIGSGLSSSIRKYVSGSGYPATVANTPVLTKTLTDAFNDRGYLLYVRGDRRNTTQTTGVYATVLAPNGVPNIGNVSFTIANSGTHAYEMLGNPYISTVDFESLMANGGNNLVAKDSRFWIWNPAVSLNGGYNLVKKVAGAWRLVPSNFNTNAGVADANSKFIQSSQAILIEPLGGGNLTFNESNKVNPAGPFPTVFDAGGYSLFYTNLNYASGSSYDLSDGVLAVFADGNTLSVSDEDDVKKISGFNESIALYRQNTRLALEAHPPVSGNDTLFLYLSGTTARAYALQFKSMHMAPGITAYLQDNFLGKEEVISVVDDVISTYNFSVTSNPASADNNRFRIVFKASPILPLSISAARAYQLNNNVQVDWSTSNERNMAFYELERSLDGRSFTKLTSIAAANTSDATYGWLDLNPVTGNNFYRIKAISTDGSIKYSQILLVHMGSGEPQFSVYPNPAKNQNFAIQFTNMEKGTYRLEILNSQGQKIFTRSLEHNGGSSSQNIQLEKTAAAGLYRIALVTDAGQRFYQTIVLQ